MAKSLLKMQARELRRGGESVKLIAKQLNVSKSSASLWVRDIILSVEQLEVLKHRSILGSEHGRLVNAFNQKQRRLRKIEQYKQLGIKRVEILSEREFLVSGLALYWGEGTKKARKVRFCNSDPALINFMIRWLSKCFGIPKKELSATIGINEIHRLREEEVRKYWLDMTKLNPSQFTRTSFKKSKLEKIYDNFNEHYGTIAISVLKPARIYYKIMGLIEALSRQGSPRASQFIY